MFVRVGKLIWRLPDDSLTELSLVLVPETQYQFPSRMVEALAMEQIAINDTSAYINFIFILLVILGFAFVSYSLVAGIHI